MGLRSGASALGGMLAGPAGAAFGSSLIGSGDYTINSNSVLTNAQVPVFREGKRSIVVKHREYISDVFSSTGFAITAYSLNPGLSNAFPWLSVVVANFEQYKFHGLVFEFKSTAGSAVSSTNNALGSVIMATEYNVNKPAFTYKQQMEAYEYSCSGKASESFLHPIECSPSESQMNLYNTRTTTVVNELRMYDLGNFYIATQGMQASNINIGELWVTYEVEFLKPILPVNSYIAESARLNGGAFNATNYYGVIVPAFTGSMSPLPVISATGSGYDTITFPSYIAGGIYRCDWLWYGAATAVAPPTVAFSNCTALNKYRLQTVSQVSNGGTSPDLFLTITIQVVNPTLQTPASIVFTSGTLPTTPVSIDFTIVQVSPSW